MLQRHTIQKLHRDERLTILLADVVDRANVGMVQGGRCLRLASETGECLRVSGYFFGQELEGDKTVEAAILGFVDHTHPPAAELLDDAVVGDGLAEQGERVPPRAAMLGVLRRRSQREHANGMQHSPSKSA